ncbi:MAG TPA: histidine kinase dimerization/phospho-acceptor domain-containing protein [Candidatus Brocadiia bacterium]|nr:histidine kinase dimerization/phospho-acceptor domain-containing protein [Candidatus Brocadiia bacterium]
MEQLEQANRDLRKEMEERQRAAEETQRLHDQLLQAQKLESLGTLASGVAHEINNRICCIMNLAHVILEGLEPASPLARYASMIISETRRAAAITKDMLSFARQDEHERAPASMQDIVGSALSLFEAAMRKDQIVLELHAPPGLPLIVCNATRIQ